MPEMAVKMLGFTPLRESENNDIRRIIQQDNRNKQKSDAEAIDEHILNPTPKTQQRLNELGISRKRVEAEMQRKNMSAADRAKALIPKKQQGNYDGMIDFEQKPEKQSKPKGQRFF